MGTRARFVVVSTIAVLLGAGVPSSAGTGSPVRASRNDELDPSAAAGYLSWAQNSRPHPRHFDVFAKPEGDPPFKVNAARTAGFGGGIDGTTLVYQQIKNGESDLKLFDLVTRTRSNPPAGVNTGADESGPSISGDHILFARERSGRRYVKEMLLFNSSTGASETLDEVTSLNRILVPGQVNGDHAVWQKCGRFGPCDVIRHEISTGDDITVPNPNDKLQYTPAVGSDGTVYYFRSGFGCGTNVTLRAFKPGTSARILVDFPPGGDGSDAYAWLEDDTTHVLYTRYFCNRDTNATNIYEVLD